MIWRLDHLINHCRMCSAQINGRWVPARPMAGPLVCRIRAAWAVLTGRADAFTWSEGQ